MNKHLSFADNDSLKFAQFFAAKSSPIGKHYLRLKPELGDCVVAFSMPMSSLGTIIGPEKEAIWAIA